MVCWIDIHCILFQKIFCKKSIPLAWGHFCEGNNIFSSDIEPEKDLQKKATWNKTECDKPLNININTLRLINFHYQGSFLNDKSLIEKLNLHNSLKNLTLSVQINSSFSNHHKYQRNLTYGPLHTAIENVLKKTHFYNLQNVNILLNIAVASNDASSSDGLTTNVIFTMLEKHCKILKNQFKQLNIAFVIQEQRSLARYQLIEWNPSINTAFLKKEKQKIDDDIDCIYTYTNRPYYCT